MSKFKKLRKDLDHQKLVELLTVGKGEWNSTKKNPFDSISKGSLIEEAKVWFYFLSSVLTPSKHSSIVRKEEAVLLYAIIKGYKMNVGKIMERSILNYYNNKYRGLIPHLATITRLCMLGRVEGNWEEKDICPKTSPLTLTELTSLHPTRARKKCK